MDLPENNKKLFRRIAENRDEQAFAIFFDRYHTKLIQFALLYIPHFDQAEDIVSNVMIRLIKNAQKVFNVENLDNYLFIAVKNEAINFIKKENKYKLKAPDSEKDFYSSEFTNPIQKLIEKELRELISDTVEDFPPKRKMVYKLIKDEGIKYEEVASLMNLSKRTVEVHLRMAIKELRIVLRRYLSDQIDRPSFMHIAKTILAVLMAS